VTNGISPHLQFQLQSNHQRIFKSNQIGFVSDAADSAANAADQIGLRANPDL
jgi:hypothetical protein